MIFLPCADVLGVESIVEASFDQEEKVSDFGLSILIISDFDDLMSLLKGLLIVKICDLVK
jgi:hypothetical protein